MSKIVENLRARIIRRETRIIELGTELLPLILEQARDLRKLRQKSKDWAADLKEIKMEARAASRYLMIADHWETPPDREVMQRLPSDVQKLEWLCRVKPADLKQLSLVKDLVRSDRTTVINEVKKLTKVPVVRKPITLDAVRKGWKSFRKNALPNLLELTPEDQQEFFAELEASLPQFRKDVFEDEEGEDMDGEDDQEEGDLDDQDKAGQDAGDADAGEAGAEAQSKPEEVPEEFKPKTANEPVGARPVGRKGGKQQQKV